MVTEIRSLIDEGVARLRRVADDPRHEAEILLGAALGRTRSFLIAHADEPVLDCEATDRYEAHVTRRSHGEPIAYIVGEKEFWSLPRLVGPDVLVPRPETELVVERALVHLPEGTRGRVLDLAAGSGAIALAIARERPLCTIVGTDVSAAAVAIARENAVRLGFANVEFRVGSWFAPVAGQSFDLVASNPPYIAEGDEHLPALKHEPALALTSGPDGLDAIRHLVAHAGLQLPPGGWLLLEHGHDQADAVAALLRQQPGWAGIAHRRDLGGHRRCTGARRTSPA